MTEIGISIFELKSGKKKKVFEYHTLPENYSRGIETINKKLGFAIQEHSNKIAKKMRY